MNSHCLGDTGWVSQVEQAVEALRNGGLVVLPTETVYGLAADASNPQAVARVFATKGRPVDHPLILHLAAPVRLDIWAAEVPDYAVGLAADLWPGPLTLVVNKTDRVGEYVTGGQTTVAIRVPDHPLAQAVLTEFGGGVVAPSANLFGHVSPTTAGHAEQDLFDRLVPDVDVIVDGGPCGVGVESTIVNCTGAAPEILRPGTLPKTAIERAAGMSLAETVDHTIRVSGGLASHYAPAAKVRLVTNVEELRPDPAITPSVGLLALSEVPTPAGVVRLAAPTDEWEYAKVLYSALREADALQLRAVAAVEPRGETSAAEAVRDRLRRAAADRSA